MIYSRWNSPSAIRNRAMRNIKRQAQSFGYTMPNDKIDTTYTHGQLLEHAELLLKDAVNSSLSRDLHEVGKVYSGVKVGDHQAWNSTANNKDFGMGTSNEYSLPNEWSLPDMNEVYDQRDRLNKAAALIIMEIERLDRMNIDGRSLGYGVFDAEYKADKKEADAALSKQSNRHRKQQNLDIYQQMADTMTLTSNVAGSNVTASTQPQFTGIVQQMPQAVPCPVH